MKIHYRLLQIDKKEHSIVVRYYTDLITEEKLANEFNEDGTIKMSENGNYPSKCRTDCNLNIFETPSPSKEDIIKIIEQSAPITWLHMQEQILNENIDTNLESIEDILYQSNNFNSMLNFNPSVNIVTKFKSDDVLFEVDDKTITGKDLVGIIDSIKSST